MDFPGNTDSVQADANFLQSVHNVRIRIKLEITPNK